MRTDRDRRDAARERRDDGFLHARLDVGDVVLHVAEARPKGHEARVGDDVPLVVLCHGFPESWFTWRNQLRALADAGFWAVAPDMRGYDESDKPKGLDAYDVDRLAGDVAGLVRALGRDRAAIVGHDWGGVVAYRFAELHPEMLQRLAILNAPHLRVMLRHLFRLPQAKKSWYIFFFLLPGIAERAVRKDDFAGMRRMFAHDGLDHETIERSIDAIRVPGALTAGMSYYRAITRRVLARRIPEPCRVDAPVLVVWGDRDRALGSELAEPAAKWFPDARVVHIPHATHWVQNDAAPEVNRLLVEFLRPLTPGGRTS